MIRSLRRGMHALALPAGMHGCSHLMPGNRRRTYGPHLPVIRAAGMAATTATAVGALLAEQAPWLIITVAFVLATLLAGVVLPAVWSRHQTRRSAALEVIKTLRGRNETR